MTLTSNVPAASVVVAGDGVSTTLKPDAVRLMVARQA
jgi:hypothetical protein